MTTKKTSKAVAEEAPVEIEAEGLAINERQDVGTLSPEPGETITLSSGFVVRVEDLRTRGLFKLLKIITRGAGPIIMQMPLSYDDPEEFQTQILGIIMMAIPEADDAAIEFLQAMVTPAEVIENPRTNDQRDANRQLMARLVEELDDPSPGDAITIISAIVMKEAGNLRELGKQLGSAMKVMTSRGAKN